MGFEGDPCMGFFCMACMAFLEGNDGYSLRCVTIASIVSV